MHYVRNSTGCVMAIKLIDKSKNKKKESSVVKFKEKKVSKKIRD